MTTVLLGILFFIVLWSISFGVNYILTVGVCWAIDSIWHTHTPFWPMYVLVFILCLVLKSGRATTTTAT